ncbi:toxin-antitoxin system YwqK family antitoxin [Prosthecobacter sp.]|uniref:toxin-antitoxin system YwqK family antitoxin n=1 Tax=Prosthecobacter sp. TaxID=1965333 RepID=UPI003783E2CC
MKQLLTFLLCAFCLTSCGEKQPAVVDFADKNVEMLNEGKEATYKGKPYTGTILSKHSNGKDKGKYPYVDGKMHGVMLEWYENGQKSAETNFDRGQRHGLNRYWDLKGRQTKEQIYDHDKSVSEKHL